jgi:hypothetical protein
MKTIVIKVPDRLAEPIKDFLYAIRECEGKYDGQGEIDVEIIDGQWPLIDK